MRARTLALGFLTLALVTTTASAADTIRLSTSGRVDAPTLNLNATVEDLATENVATYFRRGYVGYRPAYGPRYVGGYYGPRYYGGYYGARFYRPYVLPRVYYGPRYYGAYPVFSGYYAPTVGAYYGSYYGGLDLPCTSVSLTIGGRTTAIGSPVTYATPNYAVPSSPMPGYVVPGTLSTQPVPYMPRADEPVPAPVQPGTYPYDGGPQQPVPVPPSAPEESAVTFPRLSKPAIVEDLVVSIPEKNKKWTYPAYGEKPTRQGSR